MKRRKFKESVVNDARNEIHTSLSRPCESALHKACPLVPLGQHAKHRKWIEVELLTKVLKGSFPVVVN